MTDQRLPAKAVKVGVTTSEFVATVLTVLGAATASMADVLDPKIAAILMAVSTVAYTISRGLAKK